MMTLYEWTNDIFKNGPELFFDTIEFTNSKGITITRDVHRLRNCSLGLISSSDSLEWYNICRLNCEPGTIITKYEDNDWNSLYNDMLSLVKNQLTKSLLTERNCKSAKVLLDILERRDSKNWSVKKDVQIQNNDSKQPISISIVGV